MGKFISLFLCWNLETLNLFEMLERVSHRDCEASDFGDTQNPARHSLEQPVVCDTALSRRVGQDNLQNWLNDSSLNDFTISRPVFQRKVHRKWQWIALYPVRSLVPRTFYSIFHSHRQWKSRIQGTLLSKIQHSQLSCHCRGRSSENCNAIKGKWLNVLQDLNPNFLTG